MNDSFTSPTLSDFELDEDNTYMWDFCNADYCSTHRKRMFKYSCLKGAISPRCSREEKWDTRQSAVVSGFLFPKPLLDVSQ